jgi:tRNA-2-methylthio-N6-dimethylallyladenosine synthase
MASIYIETHGCQMNEADSQYIVRRAIGAGYALSERAEDASVLVLNTCTVRDNAETRAYGRINHWKAIKAADPTVRVVVAGCLAEQDRDRMPGLVAHVDAIFGTRELRKLGDQLEAWRPGFADDDRSVERDLETVIGGRSAGIAGPYDVLRAFVNIQRGCSYYCTFCIVPAVRGRFDHRPQAEILAEVRTKVACGAREIMLVGQTVNAYREPATGADFADLLELVAAIEGVERITFVSSHPKDLNEKLARTAATIPQLNPRFHLAVQSGSNAMLRRMNRKYSVEQFRERVATFLAYNPAWAITTDIIVGFPGETEDDFQATLDLCDTGMFAQAFMFMYSPRRGTPASHWDPVDPEVVRDRFARLVAVVDAHVSAYHRRKVGSTVRALIHGPSRKDPQVLTAKTLDNVTVNFPAAEAVPCLDEPWVDVRLERAAVWGLAGTAVARAGRYDAPGRVLPPPLVDLVTLR